MVALLTFFTSAFGRYLVLALVSAGILAGVYGIAYYRGYRSANAACSAKIGAMAEVAANAEADARIKEQQYTAALSAVDQHYQGVIQNDQAQLAADRRAIAAHKLVLHDPYAPDCCSLSKTPASPGGPDGSAGGELPIEPVAVLSDQATQFLVGEADRCDAIVHQLTDLQAVVIDERK